MGWSPATSFDIMNAQLIQFLSDSNFVLHRKGDIFSLGTVTKSGIIDLNET